MRQWRTTCAVLLAFGCGDGRESRELHLIESPQPHEGGGLGSGEILGELNVFVVDGRTDEILEGARVRLGDGSAEAPVSGTTNEEGLVIFREEAKDGDGVVPMERESLAGPQVVTAFLEDYAATTWFGVNGAVVTLPLDPMEEATAEPPLTASVSGTIAGWDDLDDPPSGSALLALIQYTYTPDPGADENQLEQAPGPLAEIPELTANTCFKVPDYFLDECNWTLNTRTGLQAIYAILAEVDLTTQLFQIRGFAVQTGLDLEEDDIVENVALELIQDSLAVEVDLEDPPTRLRKLSWFAAIDLGDEGQLLVPSLDGGDRIRVPEAKGDLGGSYFMVAQATTLSGRSIPSSTIVEHDPDLDDPVDPDEWLALPDDISVDPETEAYSFDRVDGASVHTVSLDDRDGVTAWNVLILDPPAPEPLDGQDGGTPATPGPVITFSLPELSPDPLPRGNLEMTVRAMEILGFDPLDFDEIRTIDDDMETFRFDALDFEIAAIVDDRVRRQSTDQDGFRRE